MDTVTSPRPLRSLTTRTLDFWMLGGASLVLWAVMFMFEGSGREAWAINHHFLNLMALSGSLAVICNYPHFMASYQLAYSQGTRFVLEHWFQLIAVPIGLIGAIGVGYALYHEPSTSSAFSSLNTGLTALGLDTQIGLGPTHGQELMSLLIQVMFFTVGWHYAKQVYGCMRVMASFDGYRLTPQQWQLVKGCLFAVWGTSFVHANVGNDSRDLHEVGYVTLGLPVWVDALALVLFLYLFCAVVLLMRDVHKSTGQRPSINMLVAPAAFIVWWLPPLVQIDFYIWIVPFFHSLQYLGFVYKIQSNRLQTTRPSATPMWGGITAMALVVVGFVTFEFIPNTADHFFDTQGELGAWFFFASAVIFINVHHYFIDNVIWRFSNNRIRQFLLS
jgi:hypothetical protein